MKTAKSILLFILVVIISGCGGKTFMDTDFEEKPLMDKTKALILMRTTGLTPDGDKVRIVTTWKNLKNENYFSTSSHLSIFGISDAHDKWFSYMVDPGTYTLTDINFHDVRFFRGGRQFFAHNLKNMCTFNVEGGDVVYLGDVFFDTQNARLIAKAINVEDHFEEAHAYLAEVYPTLSNQLTKRLITLSRGVQVIKKIHEKYGLLEQNHF